MQLTPTKKQWKAWSLPAKLTAIGLYVGLASIVLGALSLLVSLIPLFQDEIARGAPESPPSRKTSAPNQHDLNAPLEYVEDLESDLSMYLRSRQRLIPDDDLNKLLRIEVKDVYSDIYTEDEITYIGGKKRPDIRKINLSSSPGLAIQQYAVNAKVSCFELMEDSEDSFTSVPTWTSTPCQDASGGLIIDVTLSNFRSDPVILNSVDLLIAQSMYLLNDFPPGAEPVLREIHIIPVSARYIIPLSSGVREAWSYPLLPPVKIPPRNVTRIQLNMLPIAYCAPKVAEKCKLVAYGTIATFRTRFAFGDGSVLTSPQLEAVFDNILED